MAKKTKAPWELKLLKLDESPYVYIDNSVRLNCDGYNVTFQNSWLKRSVLVSWYVDGSWKGEYSLLDSEIGQKFGRPIYFSISKKIRDVEWLLNKKKLPKRKLAGFSSDWPSAVAIIKHLKKTCTKIELI